MRHAIGSPPAPARWNPPRQALDDINRPSAAASPDAIKYIPDQVASVQGKLADLNASFDKQDYAAVLAGAPAVLTEAKGLAAAAAAKRDEVMKALAAQWTELSAFRAPVSDLGEDARGRVIEDSSGTERR